MSEYYDWKGNVRGFLGVGNIALFELGDNSIDIHFTTIH